MSVVEFEDAARNAEGRLLALDRSDAVVEACRGSGNPALLAWLAEAASIGEGDRVVDIGGGLGGPAAWLSDRYGCSVTVAEPVAHAARVATRVFGLAAVVAAGDRLPFPDRAFDICLLLGVLSVVEDPVATLQEARRLAPRLSSITYVSTTSASACVGGSAFPARATLHRALDAAGWALEAGPASPSLPPPPTWQADQDPECDAEAAVVTAIGEGRIEPVLLSARTRCRG